MGKADLQLHSDFGDGLHSPAEILAAAESARLDVVALTDHDDIRGAFTLRELALRRGSPVEVVTGIEVTTRSGHLLALFVEDEIPMLRPLAETVATIHRAGGLAVVPHPLSYLTFSVGERALRDLAASGDPEVLVDGIGLHNPSYAGRVRARRAALAQRARAPHRGDDSSARTTPGSSGPPGRSSPAAARPSSAWRSRRRRPPRADATGPRRAPRQGGAPAVALDGQGSGEAVPGPQAREAEASRHDARTSRGSAGASDSPRPRALGRATTVKIGIVSPTPTRGPAARTPTSARRTSGSATRARVRIITTPWGDDPQRAT